MTKDKILETACNLFLKLGFKNVTMDDISKELSISKKTIYTHCANKKELVKETTDFMFDNIQKGIDHIRHKNHNAVNELFEIKKFVLNTLKEDDNSCYFQLQKYFPEISKKLKKKHLRAVNECIKENLKKGIDHKLYRKDIDIDFISRIYFIGITGIKDEEAFPSNLYLQKDLTTNFLDYHIRAIATEKGLKILNQFINTNKS